MEPQTADVLLHLQLVHVAGEVLDTTHLLEHWLLDDLEGHPQLAEIKVHDNDDEDRVVSWYRVEYDGHTVAMEGASPDLHGGGRLSN